MPQNVVESIDGSTELERMQQGYRVIELALGGRVTRRGEMDHSEGLANPM